MPDREVRQCEDTSQVPDVTTSGGSGCNGTEGEGSGDDVGEENKGKPADFNEFYACRSHQYQMGTPT